MVFFMLMFYYFFFYFVIVDCKVNQLCVLIMVLMCEFVVQIYVDVELLVEVIGLKLGLVYGGDGYDKQLKVLESGVDILIGIMGCLIDYVKQNYINFGVIQVVVLDEVDCMYDLGFIKDICWLFCCMLFVNQCFNMLFFVMFLYWVCELVFEQMNNVEYIEVELEQKMGYCIKEEFFYFFNEEKMCLL